MNKLTKFGVISLVALTLAVPFSVPVIAQTVQMEVAPQQYQDVSPFTTPG
jgi:hypothetical protein